MTAATE